MFHKHGAVSLIDDFRVKPKNARTLMVIDMKKERETARQKLAREIHDDIGQPLTAAKLIIERLRRSPDKHETLLEQVRDLISEAQVKAGSLCRELQEEPKSRIGTTANRKARG